MNEKFWILCLQKGSIDADIWSNVVLLGFRFFHNWIALLPWPLEWATVKCKYANRKPCWTYYLMALVIFNLSATIYEIFWIEICMTLTLTFIMGQGQMVKCKYTNRKSTGDFLCIGNNNICPSSHRLRDIRSKFCMTLTLTFRMGQGQM